MPVVLRPSKVHAKDPTTGEYLPQNVIGDKTTEELVETINDAGDAKLQAIETLGSTTETTINNLRGSSINAIEAKKADALDSIPDDYSEMAETVKRLAAEETGLIYKYGASGFNNSDPTLTRLYDAVGMVAEVGTDDATVAVRNDFDAVPLFARRKCVGYWTAGVGKAVFHVNAYEGDPDYTEDGTNGDYVAVDCHPAYYWESSDHNIRVVSSTKLPGYRPFECLETEKNSGICRAHTYLPAYALAFDADGHAVSLPGFANRQGDYNSLLNAARTYNNADAKQYAMLEPASVNFYEETLYDIEFATHNCQSIMRGSSELLGVNNLTVVLQNSGKWITSTYQAELVPGSIVAVDANSSDIKYGAGLYPTHRITEAVRCDETGAASDSGTHTLLTLEQIDSTKTFEEGTTYYISHRPYITGSANSVATPSGSPVSNSDGLHPMRYRYRENVFGNQFHTIMDVFIRKIGTDDTDWELEWYKLLDPVTWSGNPSEAQLQGNQFAKLSVITEHENYKNGYAVGVETDPNFPEVRVPIVDGTGSSATHTCDYAILVDSHVVRSLRLVGIWYTGLNAGFESSNASNAPSHSNATYGGGLYFAQ